MGECQQSRTGGLQQDPLLPEDQGDLVAEGVKTGWGCDISGWLVADT